MLFRQIDKGLWALKTDIHYFENVHFKTSQTLNCYIIALQPYSQSRWLLSYRPFPAGQKNVNGLTVPGCSMILPGTISETPISCEQSWRLERPPDHILYCGFVNRAVNRSSAIHTSWLSLVEFLWNCIISIRMHLY